MIALRPPLRSPVGKNGTSNALSTRPRLCVRHPAYAGVSSELLSLVATDGDSHATCGVQLALVHAACAIIADNRFDGWLSSSDRPDDPPVRSDGDAILPATAAAYYFHVPPDPDTATPLLPSGAWPYPIVPNFRSWEFPHARIPQLWVQALADAISPFHVIEPSVSLPIAVKMRDVSCRLTNHSEATEYAHILPASEKEWFSTNGMDQYRTSNSRAGQDVVNAECNAILLRSDTHSLWDRMRFMVVPKCTASDARPTLVAHVSDTSQELHAIYHNQVLQPIRGIPTEYIFARFAWHILPDLRGFLQRRQKRVLAVRQKDGTVDVREYSPDECLQFCLDQGRGRSASPSKRKRPEQDSTTPAAVSDGASFDSGVSGFGRKDVNNKEDNGRNDRVEYDNDNETDGSDFEAEQALETLGWIDPFGHKRRRKQAAMERLDCENVYGMKRGRSSEQQGRPNDFARDTDEPRRRRKIARI